MVSVSTKKEVSGTVVRALIEQEGKQIVLLSHKGQWIRAVSSGCRSVNGCLYEITGYTQEGPHLRVAQWAQTRDRLREADSIANDPHATSIRLQQAEEELRLAACQIASDIAAEKLKRFTSAHNMNGKDVRAIMNQAGYPAETVDKVAAVFSTADDAHHAPKQYQPNAHRIRQHIATLRSLISAA